MVGMPWPEGQNIPELGERRAVQSSSHADDEMVSLSAAAIMNFRRPAGSSRSRDTGPKLKTGGCLCNLRCDGISTEEIPAVRNRPTNLFMGLPGTD